MADILEDLARSEQFKKINEIKIDMNILFKISFGFLLFYIIANFPDITIPRAFGEEIVISLIPYTIKMSLKYLITVLEFFILLGGIFFFHAWLIVQCVNIYLFLKNFVRTLIKFLDNI